MKKSSVGFLIVLATSPVTAHHVRMEGWPVSHVVRPWARSPQAADTIFARLIQRLSEPGGYFDTDNLISNETSYLHPVGSMRRLGISGGAYIGVGPDQNFSYIAHIRPRIAFIIDIRRDNLLQHFLFKSLFALAPTRIEYLALLFGRPTPPNPAQWASHSVEALVNYVDTVPARREIFEQTRTAVRARVLGFGLPLSSADLETIDRIHESFFRAGFDLRFTSTNRPPRPYYPTYRQLTLETDLTGRSANYLASEADYQFLRSLEQRHLIIPVVGDLAGDHALAAIGRTIAARGERVSVFYTSNVEFYLMRGGGQAGAGSFDRFVQTLSKLPRGSRTVIIRSFFGGPYGYAHPHQVPGYYSTQLLQPIDSLIAEYGRGGIRSYQDLVTKHALELH